WFEVWDVLRPLIDTPFQGGPATWIEDFDLELKRHCFVEECHFTVAYSRVPDETAPRGIGGVLATVHEITEQVIGERRTKTLRDLGARSAEAKTAEEACSTAAQILSRHTHDVPFALLYLMQEDGSSARLAGASGVAMDDPVGPLIIELGGVAAPVAPSDNGLRQAVNASIRTESVQILDDLASRFHR